ncbi:MAG: cell division protein ZapB [Thermodesulfobacteriota bacterium]
MHLEKLDLLEQRLTRLVDHFNRLKEEKILLERRLEEKTGRLGDLEREVEEFRKERDVIRERLGRLVETLERLEALEAAAGGGAT